MEEKYFYNHNVKYYSIQYTIHINYIARLWYHCSIIPGDQITFPSVCLLVVGFVVGFCSSVYEAVTMAQATVWWTNNLSFLRFHFETSVLIMCQVLLNCDSVLLRCLINNLAFFYFYFLLCLNFICTCSWKNGCFPPPPPPTPIPLLSPHPFIILCMAAEEKK